MIQQKSKVTREIDLGWLNGQPLVQGKGQKMATLVIKGKEEVKQEVIVCSMKDCEDTRVVFGLITKSIKIRLTNLYPSSSWKSMFRKKHTLQSHQYG